MPCLKKARRLSVPTKVSTTALYNPRNLWFHGSGPARGFGYTVCRVVLIHVYGIFWSKFGRYLVSHVLRFFMNFRYIGILGGGNSGFTGIPLPPWPDLMGFTPTLSANFVSSYSPACLLKSAPL